MGEWKSIVEHAHDTTWREMLHAKMGWNLRVTWGEKHKSNEMEKGVFLHASEGVTYDLVIGNS